MNKEENPEDIFNRVINGIEGGFQRIDGKIIGEDVDFVKEKMAKDDRGAWINHIVEQYLKKEKIDEIPENLNIKIEDIVREIAKREIEKVLGNIK